MSAPSLWRHVPKRDFLSFGLETQFEPQRVVEWLDLRNDDVARIAGISLDLLRYDDEIPPKVRDHLREIAVTCNIVAEAYDGNVSKTAAWFRVRIPLLGDVSPRDMIRLGRLDRLCKFIISAQDECFPPHPPVD